MYPTLFGFYGNRSRAVFRLGDSVVFPAARQLLFINDRMLYIITSPEAYPAAAARQLRGLYGAWRTGNATLLAFYNGFEDPFASDEEKALAQAFRKAMLTDRNVGMADFAEAQLGSGQTVFLAVGAGHMIGMSGVVSLLRARGYIIEEIGR